MVRWRIALSLLMILCLQRDYLELFLRQRLDAMFCNPPASPTAGRLFSHLSSDIEMFKNKSQTYCPK